jgi:hypothetical protein
MIAASKAMDISCFIWFSTPMYQFDYSFPMYDINGTPQNLSVPLHQ